MRTTTDGWIISTVEPEGEYAGLEMGRLWLHSPTPRVTLWHWYEADSVPDARRLADRAATMTREDFEAYHAAQ